MATIFGDARPLPAPTTFQTAIGYSSSHSIHQASGRAIVLGTDIYYSPNCSLIPRPPPPATSTYVRDPFKDSVEEFHHPHWWTIKAGYLPFLPTFPNFHCPPFHVLFNDPIQTGARQKRRIQMDSNDILSWSRLENALARVFKDFQSTYSIPPMPPVIQTSLACQTAFEYPSQFKTAEKRSRSWFAVPMAMVSLGIAIAQISDGGGEPETVPHWYHTFVRHIEEHALSGIRQQLGQFSTSYTRAGVFLDLKSSEEQPTVDFFVRLGVPVWYPWGRAEESLTRKNPNFWRKYIPPTHLLQRAHSYLTLPLVPAPSVSCEQHRPWESFFAERQRRATGSMPTRKPAMKVFHWQKDFNGDWNRIQVVKRMQSATLDDYGVNQKMYDEQNNEWDCCTEMGELDASEMQAADWEDGDEPILPLGIRPALPVIDESPPKATHAPLPTPILSSVSGGTGAMSGITDSGLRGPYIPEQHSPADILRLFFGFIAPPPSVRLSLNPPSEQQKKDLALGIGFTATEDLKEYIDTAEGKYAANFFWSISQTPLIPPSNALFDLATGNPRSLLMSKRLKFLRQLPQNIYVFDFKGEATVDWKIAVKDVTDVLFILRLKDDLNDYDITRELLNRGIPFVTLLPVPFSIVNSIPKAIPSIRTSSHVFGLSDYDSYCRERDELLRNPRVARQALMRGGIIWRLAMDVASFQDVLAGPTIVATLRHQCVSVSTNSGLPWIDDVGDKTETDIISGVYYVYTGKIFPFQLFNRYRFLLYRSGLTNCHKVMVATY